jgi:putative SOS response-associated peptidase YedK
VILAPHLWDDWLHAEPDAAGELLVCAREPMLAHHPVPKAVGSPKNDLSELFEPIELEA